MDRRLLLGIGVVVVVVGLSAHSLLAGSQSYEVLNVLTATAPSPGLKECINRELTYDKIEQTLFDSWRTAWVARDAQAFAALFAADASQTGIIGIPQSPTMSRDGIDEFVWKSGSLGWSEYLSQFSAISDVTLVGQQINAQPGHYAEAMSVRVRFDVRGTKDGAKREDRGIIDVAAVNEAGVWKIQGITLASGETLVLNRQPDFTDVTDKVGLAGVPIALRTEAIRRGGYALAVGNILGDGKESLYVGSRDKGTLWQEGSNGVFSQLNKPFTSETLVKTALFDDFTNSGQPDALFVRFSPAVSTNHADLAFYRNQAGSYTSQNDFLNKRWPTPYAMPATVADFNNDGLLDFYVGFPGKRDFTALGQTDMLPQGTAVEGLFLNKGDGTFKDATDALGTAAITPTTTLSTSPQMLYPHSAMAVDFDRDGKQDIVVMDDRGNLGPVYHNKGDGTFEDVARPIGLGLNNVGMGVAAADVFGTGRLDFVMSYVNVAAADRIANICPSVSTAVTGMQGGGLRFFKSSGAGTFTDDTDAAGLSWAGQGVGGVEFIDYNNDGYPDIFVSNGLWSGTDRKSDAGGLFVLNVMTRHGNDVLNDLTPQKSDWMSFLGGFRGNMLTGSQSSSGQRPSLLGYQHDRLFRNNGNGTFTEVGYLEGVDSIADGYVAARADLNQDGKVDLVLRNGDPGTSDYTYPVVQAFENTSSNANSLRISLVGDPQKGSNLDAIGSEVTVVAGGHTQYQELLANNGPSQSEHVLYFGLGASTRADKVTVRFPSGEERVLTNVQAGAITLKQ